MLLFLSNLLVEILMPHIPTLQYTICDFSKISYSIIGQYAYKVYIEETNIVIDRIIIDLLIVATVKIFDYSTNYLSIFEKMSFNKNNTELSMKGCMTRIIRTGVINYISY